MMLVMSVRLRTVRRPRRLGPNDWGVKAEHSSTNDKPVEDVPEVLTGVHPEEI